MIVNILTIPVHLGNLSDEQVQEELLFMLRMNRDNYLKLCDWTQLPDAPLSEEQKSAWNAYRQALRDLPEVVGTMNISGDVEFPDPPN